MTPEYIVSRVKGYGVKDAEIINTEFGTAVKITGKGAKITALMYSRELYYDGIVNTNWNNVRHGLGYLIPFYDNPLDSIL
jgi:hypothetical protein